MRQRGKVTPTTSKNVYGLDPGIALDSTRVYLSLWRDPRYISPVLLPLCARVSPTNRYANVRGKVGSIVCSLTQSFHFLSYLVFSNQIFQYPLLISTVKMPAGVYAVYSKIEKRGKVKERGLISSRKSSAKRSRSS